MRPKVVIACLVIAVVVMAVIFKAAPPSTPPPAPEKSEAKAAPKTETKAVVVKPIATVPPSTNRQDHAAYVEQRVEELEKLAMRNDKDAMLAILQELNNPDKQIRTAALEALKQYRSRDAIPGLQEQLARTDDPAEKAEIQETIDWLKLPTFTEYRAQMKAKRDADAAAGIEPPPKKPRTTKGKGLPAPVPVQP
jgi:hypothetical protein